MCTTIDDDIFLSGREAYEYERGRWKRGSLKELLEAGLKLYAAKYGLKDARK